MFGLLEIAGSLGVGCFLAVLIFLMYRRDRKSSEDRLREDRKFMEDRLSKIIDRDQKTRKDHTKALAQLITLLKGINGRLKN